MRNEKQLIRQQLKSIRSSLEENQRRLFSKHICSHVLSLAEVNQAKSLFVYVSYADEVATHLLIKTFLQQKKTLYAPKILSPTVMEAHKFTDWNELIRDKLGILAPISGERNEGGIDVVITPGLGFTPQGNRIGYGAGYYDRWFHSNTIGKKIALCFECQLLPKLPLETTDVPVDKVVTEQRIITVL